MQLLSLAFRTDSIGPTAKIKHPLFIILSNQTTTYQATLFQLSFITISLIYISNTQIDQLDK